MAWAGPAVDTVREGRLGCQWQHPAEIQMAVASVLDGTDERLAASLFGGAATVLQRLGEVDRLDRLGLREVCDRPRDFEDAMKGARGECKALHRRGEEGLRGRREALLAELAHLQWPHLGVGEVG